MPTLPPEPRPAASHGERMENTAGEKSEPGTVPMTDTKQGAIEQEPDEPDMEENWPWCMCDLEWTEEEEAENQCAACGKAIS